MKEWLRFGLREILLLVVAALFILLHLQGVRERRKAAGEKLKSPVTEGIASRKTPIPVVRKKIKAPSARGFAGLRTSSEALTDEEKEAYERAYEEFKKDEDKYRDVSPMEAANLLEDKLGIDKDEQTELASKVLARIRQEEESEAEKLKSFLLGRIDSLKLEKISVDSINRFASISFWGRRSRERDIIEEETGRKIIEVISLVFAHNPQIQSVRLYIYYPTAEDKFPEMSFIEVKRDLYAQIDSQAMPSREILKRLNKQIR